MSEFKFKASMFRDCDGSNASLAEKAQSALDQYLKTCQRAYGFIDSYGKFVIANPEDNGTHEAYLFNLRPIEKPECEHDPKFLRTTSIGEPEIICRKCGVGLKQKWEAV